MIAHAFPPEGNAGAYRPFRFVRHLPMVGWSPCVITAETASYERYDPGLLALVPPDIEVIRVRSRDPWQSIQTRRARRIQSALASGSPDDVARLLQAQRAPLRSFLRRAVRRAEAWYYHPDFAMGWIRPAVAATIDLVRRKRSEVIWATAGPVSSLVVAGRASRATGVPYVLDFRDAWTITYNEFEATRPSWAARADRRVLFQLLAGARAITFRYITEAECYWRAYPGALDASRIHIIPNGFEGSIERGAFAQGDKCRILYAGTLSSYRYDTLLQALQELKAAAPARASRLAVLVVGEGSEALSASAAALGLSDIVQSAGPTSHDRIDLLQQQAHALLVLGRPQSFKGHELFAGAKLFGYLKAGRPIVGVLPADETNKILQRVGVSTIADSASVPKIVAVLTHVLEAWSDGTLGSLVPDPAACSIYSAEHQTAALARALQGRPAAEPFVPGIAEVPPSLREEIHAEQSPDLRARNAFLHP